MVAPVVGAADIAECAQRNGVCTVIVIFLVCVNKSKLDVIIMTNNYQIAMIISLFQIS